jgi:hypothetical protein
LRPAEEAKADASKEGEGQTAAPTPPDPHAPKPAPVKEAALVDQEATQLNQQLSPWVFTLNKTKAKNLVKEMSELVKDKS